MEKKISIDGIIVFVEKAIEKGFIIDTWKTLDDKRYIYIKKCKNGDSIRFVIDDQSITIDDYSPEECKITHQLEDRERIKLDSLVLDIEEYNEKRALNLFNNFFNEEDKCDSINDLYDE